MNSSDRTGHSGQHEACELRDGDKSKWGGKGVEKAVKNVNDVIGPAIIKENIDVKDQPAVDAFLKKLDGTTNKTNLGANAILGVSLAVAKAGAAEKVGICQNVISENSSALTELSVLGRSTLLSRLGSCRHEKALCFARALHERAERWLPCWWSSCIPRVHDRTRVSPAFCSTVVISAKSDCSSTAPSFREAMRQGSEVYQQLKSLAKKKYGQSAGNVGDEGGVAPDIQTAEEALDLITEAIEKAGYTGKVKIAMDVASSEFYKDDAKKYDLDFKNPDSDKSKWITYEQLADMYKSLASKYPIVSIEDPFAEDDWEAWSYFFKTSDFQIVG